MQASQVDISKALAILGWMSEEELTWLAERARESEKIVEFGSYLGRSTRAMADNTEGTIWAVDPWNGSYPVETGMNIDTYVLPQFKHNLKDHSERVIPVRMPSGNFDLPFKIDMLFIDGDHRFESVQKDILWGIRKVRSGGIISGHDYYDKDGWQGVKQAVDKFFPARKVVDTIWWVRAF